MKPSRTCCACRCCDHLAWVWVKPAISSLITWVLIGIGCALWHTGAMSAHEQSDVVLASLGLVPEEVPLWELGLPLAIRVTTAVLVVLGAGVPVLLFLKAWINWVTRKQGSSPRWARLTVNFGNHVWVGFIFVINVYNCVCVMALAGWLIAAVVMDKGGQTLADEYSVPSRLWAKVGQLWYAGVDFTAAYDEIKEDLTPELLDKLQPTYERIRQGVFTEGTCPSYCLLLSGALWHDETECMCNLTRVDTAAEEAEQVWREYLIRAIIGMFLCYCGFYWGAHALSRDIGHTQCQAQAQWAAQEEARRKAISDAGEGGRAGDPETGPPASASAFKGGAPPATAAALYSWDAGSSHEVKRSEDGGPLLASKVPAHTPSCAPPGDASLVSSSNGVAMNEAHAGHDGHASVHPLGGAGGKGSSGIGRHQAGAYPDVPNM